MKQLLIVGNWKANKTQLQTKQWFEEFSNYIKTEGLNKENKELIICPSFTNLETAKESAEEFGLPIKIGSQDVSKFRGGAQTGEVTAEMLNGIVEYSIVGHSERRKYFNETNEDVMEKIILLLEFKIKPILCISDLSQLNFYVSKEPRIKKMAKDIVFVYEPPDSISGGKDYKPVSTENVISNIVEMKTTIGKNAKVLYGASINSENVASLFSKPEIDGGLSGQASLDPLHFLKLINI